jgi:hypothetical protein
MSGPHVRTQETSRMKKSNAGRPGKQQQNNLQTAVITFSTGAVVCARSAHVVADGVRRLRACNMPRETTPLTTPTRSTPLARARPVASQLGPANRLGKLATCSLGRVRDGRYRRAGRGHHRETAAVAYLSTDGKPPDDAKRAKRTTPLDANNQHQSNTLSDRCRRIDFVWLGAGARRRRVILPSPCFKHRMHVSPPPGVVLPVRFRD